jgi:MYXO-CTERM domain-containing protein
MTPRPIAGLIVGASLVGGIAAADPVITTLEAHDDMHAGALWRNDRPNNNNQRGVGCEHQSIVQLANNHILVVCSGSYTDVTPMIAGAGLSSADAGVLPPSDGDPGVQAQGNRVEGLCLSYKLDATMGLVKTNMAYFTNNKSPDWQNMHKAHAQPVNSGAAALVEYGYDPDGTNTKVFGMVLGPNCEILSKQTQLYANTNDNLGGLFDSSDNTYSDVNGVTRSCGGNIGNGNGDDDVWAHCTQTTATGQAGTAAYTITPQFKIVLDPEEERSRGTTQPTPFKDLMFACWASGNTQPPNSTKCGLVNTAPGVANNQRLMWRQTLAQRSGNIRYSTPSLVPVLGTDGKPTDTYIASYVKVDVSNRNGRSKGRTAIQTVPLKITQTGMTMLDKPVEGMFGIADGAHPGMTTARYGADGRPVAFLFAGSLTDGGTATAKVVGITPDGKLEPIRALNWADASSGGYTSQWYGHNPNTPQGRGYPVTSLMIDNLGYHQTGGFQPDVKSFILVANVHHKDHAGQCTPDPNKGTNNGTCGGKNAFSMVLIPSQADDSKPVGGPDDPNPSDPTGGGGSDPGTTLGGCSTTGGAGAGTLMLLGLAAILVRRRRSH